MATATTARAGDILVPRHTVHLDYDGRHHVLVGGVTRIRKGHPIIKAAGGLAEFQEAPSHVDYELE